MRPPLATAGPSPLLSPAGVGGANRFSTAASIATETFDEADVAVLATGEDFPDALAASFAAGSVDGPVLLTRRGSVPDEALEALEALGVQRVVLIGGNAAISVDVADDLAAGGYDVERVAGEDRFATAIEVALRFGPEDDIGVVDGDRAAILASGEEFADALSAGPLAAAARLPLLLTPSDRVMVVGGEAAVSEAVVAAYAADYEVERLGGATRTGTAAVVAENLVERFGLFSRELVLLARGDDFPDALAASMHGAATGRPDPPDGHTDRPVPGHGRLARRPLPGGRRGPRARRCSRRGPGDPGRGRGRGGGLPHGPRCRCELHHPAGTGAGPQRQHPPRCRLHPGGRDRARRGVLAQPGHRPTDQRAGFRAQRLHRRGRRRDQRRRRRGQPDGDHVRQRGVVRRHRDPLHVLHRLVGHRGVREPAVGGGRLVDRRPLRDRGIGRSVQRRLRAHDHLPGRSTSSESYSWRYYEGYPG